MSFRQLLTVRQRVTGCCWTLFAIAILTAPGLAWAQDCNAVVDVSTSPSKPGWVDGGAQDRYYQLGDTVRVSLEVGAGTIGGLPLLVEQFRAALDCQSVDVVNREICLGYTALDPATQDDGDAILYLGALAVTGVPCEGHTFTLSDLTTPQNLLAFDVTPAVDFAQGERCVIAFDVSMNNYGIALDQIPSRPGVQYLYSAGGFEGACAETTDGAPSASGRNSTGFQFRSVPLIEIVKQVSVDGGPWLNFAEGTYGTSTGEYRLLVTNPATFVDPITGVVEGETLVGVVLNDATLNLVNVPLPARCEPFAPGDTCTIDSGDAGFDSQYGNLGGVDVCQTFPDPYINEACTEGTGTPSGILAGPACDSAEVLCVGTPEIDIIKYVWDPAISDWVDANVAPGPTYPVGAVISYKLDVCNIGNLDLDDVQVFDPALSIPPTSIGSLPASSPFDALISCETLQEGVGPVSGLDSPIPCSESRQFENIAFADGFYLGGQGPVTDNDPANVICVPPELEVVKTGEGEAKVGDIITYDVTATNTSATVALANCVATDTLPGVTLPAPFDLAPLEQVPYSYDYQVPAGAPNPLPNTARVDCDVVGTAAGTIWDDSPWDVDLFTVGATMDKECSDGLGTGNKNLVPGDTIEWDIEVCNTGTADITCTVNDLRAGVTGAILAIPGTTGAPNCDSVIASDSVEAGDAPAILNDATADCTVDDYDNTIEQLTADDACPVTVINELCRTPGFWKTHAGVEKADRSNNLTQAVIDFNGGSLGFICGVEITDTSTYDYVGTGFGTSDGYESAVEGMCVHPKQQIIRQLQRQLIAAALNCVASGGSADCTGVSVGPNWKLANTACVNEAADMSSWIDEIDDFNNGVGDYTCLPKIQDSIVFDGWTGPKLPGPAGSSNACSEATYNDFYLVPLPSGLNP